MDNTVWRVVADQYTLPPFDPLDGKGAERIGGRWNSPGVAVTYLSGSLSLAVLEVLVHSGRIDSLTGKMAIALTVPERDIRTIRTSEMPQDWQIRPPITHYGRSATAGLRKEIPQSCVCRVPSFLSNSTICSTRYTRTSPVSAAPPHRSNRSRSTRDYSR